MSSDPLVTRTVYGLYLPESRRIVDALWSERPHAAYERNYTGRQDSMHEALMSRWRAWAADAGVKLGDGYRHEYPTAGANEGIHAVLAHHATHGGRRIHVFSGEYEGYGYTATSFGLQVVEHPRGDDRLLSSLRGSANVGDLFFVSQPSAIDGNLWTGFASFRESLEKELPGVNLVVDLTYVGGVDVECRIDLDHENVSAVLWSLSKPFGIYYHRIGGLLTRTAIPALGGSHWFKNLFAILLGERLLAAHSARDLAARHRRTQRLAIERAKAEHALPDSARGSDAILLAHLPREIDPGPSFGKYARGEGFRFCLTGAMDRVLTERGV